MVVSRRLCSKVTSIDRVALQSALYKKALPRLVAIPLALVLLLLVVVVVVV